jgi:hypothetical protein
MAQRLANPGAWAAWVAGFATLTCGGGGEEVAPLVCGDADEGEPGPNDERSMAKKIAAGKAIDGCIDAESDSDAYILAAPMGPAGGFLKVSVQTLGGEKIGLALFNLRDEGRIIYAIPDGGDKVNAFLAMVPGEIYAVELDHAALDSFPEPYAYRLLPEVVAIVDEHEPNDVSGKAKKIGVGKEIKGMLFAGYTGSGPPPTQAYDDWFAVDLQDGDVTVSVEDVPSSLQLRAELWDANKENELLCRGACSTDGPTLEATASGVKKGSYLLRITKHGLDGQAAGRGADPPAHFLTPYRAKITQQKAS